MGDALLLGVGEAGQHALDHAEDLRQAERADERAQRAPADVLHGDVGHAAVLEEVEQRDDVRVIERGRQARLADEALRSCGVVAVEVEPLERYLAVERRLPREVHDGHPATGEHPDDLVRADAVSIHRLRATLSDRALARGR